VKEIKIQKEKWKEGGVREEDKKRNHFLERL
jgi:hypothetical protein